MHIVTTALVSNANQSTAPAEENTDAGPFTALLDEHMQVATHAPVGDLPVNLSERPNRGAEADDKTAAAPDSTMLTPALIADARREERPTPAATGNHLERADIGATTNEGRNTRPNTRALPTAAQNTPRSAPVAIDATRDVASVATSSAAPSFELGAATKVEAPAPTVAAHGVSAPQATERPAVATPVHTLQQPVGSERWTNELGQTVQLIVRAEQQSATLHVTPPELGPIDVQIDLSGDQASLSFNVQNADTRSALENAMPRLREMLAEGGIALGDAQVNQQSGEQRETAGQSQQRGGGASLSSAATVEAVPVRARVGLVDTFA